MDISFERPLNSPKIVRDFLQKALRWEFKEGDDIDSMIIQGQNGLLSFEVFKSYNTLDYDDYRAFGYVSIVERMNLRRQIVEELFTLPRLGNDDDIVLGTGGAAPNSDLKKEKEAILIIGLPASGKSGIASNIADHKGAVILDSDYAKRKIPEFAKYPYGATLVHKESGALISGFKTYHNPVEVLSLSERCIIEGINVVIPKIGHQWRNMLKLAEDYISLGYKVHLTLVNLDRVKATIRAINRYKVSGRYVPISLIFDGYANDPILTYYQLKNHFRDKFTSFGILNTNVSFGQDPECIDNVSDNPSGLYNTGNFS